MNEALKLHQLKIDDQIRYPILSVLGSVILAVLILLMKIDENDWISIDDRLPPVGTMVEVYMFEPSNSDTNYAICYFTKYGFDRSKVTHWKYLSKPPIK